MTKVFHALFLVATITLLSAAGCTTPGPTAPAGTSSTVILPQSPIQSVYAAEVALTAATNALADVHDKGILVGDNYVLAKSIQTRAHATLLTARAAAQANDATKTSVLIGTVIGLTQQIGIYNGGVTK